MKFVALLLIILTLTPAFHALGVKKPSLASIKKIENLLADKNSWSAIMLNMAEL